jgi:hypothetical protein
LNKKFTLDIRRVLRGSAASVYVFRANWEINASHYFMPRGLRAVFVRATSCSHRNALGAIEARVINRDEK